MKKKKDRSNKKHIPRSRDDIKLKFEPWRVKAVFDPLTSILDEMEKFGTSTVYGADDKPMFKDAVDGDWYDTVAGLSGILEAFEIYERRAGIDMQMDPLRTLIAKLDKGELVDAGDTRAVRACIDRMWAAAMNMTVGEARQLINDFNIKEGIEKLM